ncbi:MAG: hypothetical protein N2442_10525 [Spirochaetes bacterium]|nr:hypothetical protein [Spirochaetota bacterium]
MKEHIHRRLFREDLRARARKDAERIAAYLKETYQAEVYGIGSVFDTSRPFGPHSDIDLVAKGLPKERYFHILDEAAILTSFRLDLIPYEDATVAILQETKDPGRRL